MDKLHFDILEMRECEYDDILGDLRGYFCEEHVDLDTFYNYALCKYKEHIEDEDNDPCDIFGDLIPFSRDDIKYGWYRYPTEQEQETNGMHPYEFIMAKKDENKDNYSPITYVDFF